MHWAGADYAREALQHLDGGGDLPHCAGIIFKLISALYLYLNTFQGLIISAQTANMAKHHPKLASRIHVGTAFEQRPMYLLRV